MEPERHRRRSAAPRYLDGWPRRLITLAGVLLIVAGLGLAANVLFFYRHSSEVGSGLIRTEQHAVHAARSSGGCTGTGTTTTAPAGTVIGGPGSSLAAATGATPNAGGTPTPDGLLEAPTIGLVAPVVEGVEGAQLSVAVGHVPESSWPGPTGTSVLAAHDVTWFSQIDQLNAGDLIDYVTPCQTIEYEVDGHQVVSAGTPIYSGTTGKLVLVTCYPLDALYLTSQRFLLEAHVTRVVDVRHAVGAPHATATPTVPVPLPLYAQGLTLADNPAPLGSLTITGSPTGPWRQSAAPLNDEGAALALYFAALRSGEQNHADWWSDIAPGESFAAAAPLVAHQVSHNNQLVTSTLDVSGTALVGVTLVSEPMLSDGAVYRVEMTASVRGTKLVISNWVMTPAG